jgi:arylesterase/paraoxonase
MNPLICLAFATKWHQIKLPKQIYSMTYRESISYPDLVSPNDLIAVGPSQFYVTNDHRYAPGNPMQLVEDYLGLPLSNVSYYDGTHGSIGATGLRFANGITATNDLKTFFVSQATGRKISVFNRDSSTNELTKQSDIAIKFGPDNLEWDTQGNLWVAGHPRLFDFLAHTDNADNHSPSQVVKIDVNSTKPVTSNIYLSMGADISGATVAAVYNGTVIKGSNHKSTVIKGSDHKSTINKSTMLIGSVYEPRILRCQL